MRRAPVLAFLWVGLGCGSSDPCQQISGAFSSLEGRLPNCVFTNSPFSQSSCESGLSACSVSDKTTLDSLASCINAIPGGDCDTDESLLTNVPAALMSCGENNAVSVACAPALGSDVTESAVESAGGTCPAQPTELTGTSTPGAVCATPTTCAPLCCDCPNSDGDQFLAAVCENQQCAAATLVCSLAADASKVTASGGPCP